MATVTWTDGATWRIGVVTIGFADDPEIDARTKVGGCT